MKLKPIHDNNYINDQTIPLPTPLRVKTVPIHPYKALEILRTGCKIISGHHHTYDTLVYPTGTERIPMNLQHHEVRNKMLLPNNVEMREVLQRNNGLYLVWVVRSPQ
jgi:hypothetical protein